MKGKVGLVSFCYLHEYGLYLDGLSVRENV